MNTIATGTGGCMRRLTHPTKHVNFQKGSPANSKGTNGINRCQYPKSGAVQWISANKSIR